MILLPLSRCCCCSDDCEGTVIYEISVCEGTLSVSGSFTIADGAAYFSVFPSTGGYLSGSITLECEVCEVCEWQVTAVVCYACGPNEDGVTEIWQGTMESVDGCPPPGPITVEPVDPPSEVSITLALA